MSVKDESKLFKTPFHQRHESDELDVFEAAGYFSGYNEATAFKHNNNINGATHKIQKPTSELLPENQYYNKQTNRRSLGRRMSLDVPLRDPIPQQAHSAILDKQILKGSNNNKYKQPSSPGGRLASFLNSLFNQAGSKKKNKTKSVVDEESPGGWRRRRRSSISHFRSSSTTSNNTNVIITTTTGSSHSKSSSTFSPSGKLPPLDHHVKVNLSLGGAKSNDNEEDEAGMDDVAESDSSSDLFELQNYDLGLDVYSSGLPVYETTSVDIIKRGAPFIS